LIDGLTTVANTVLVSAVHKARLLTIYKLRSQLKYEFLKPNQTQKI